MSNQIILGAGDLWVKAIATTPTPVRIATLKKISLNLTKESIDLTGAYEFPIDTAGGKATCKGKATIAGFETKLVASVFGSTTETAGYTALSVDEAQSIPATPGPYTVTTTHAADFAEDFGVLWTVGTELVPMTRVTGTPTTGQYAVDEATGIYTFAAADQGKAVKISYSYDVAASGTTLDIKSGLIGSAPGYLLQGWNIYKGKKIGYRLPTVTFTGLSFEMSTEAHVSPEYDFSATALPGASVLKMFFA